MFQWVIVNALLVGCALIAVRSVWRFVIALNRVPSDPSTEKVGCHACPANPSPNGIKVLPLVTLKSKPPA